MTHPAHVSVKNVPDILSKKGTEAENGMELLPIQYVPL